MQLASKYVVPLAMQLDAFYGGGVPFDLASIFEDADSLPAPPDRAGAASWAAWLRQCPDDQAERVLAGIESLPAAVAAAQAARAELVRTQILERASVADRLVVNRKALIGHVKAMLDERWRILRIDGGTGAGKTFTRHVLRCIHSAGIGGDHQVIEIDVPSYLGLPALAGGMCNAIDGQDARLPNREDTTPDKWIELVAQQVIRKAISVSGPVWWVLDDCSRVTANDVLTFLRRLAEGVEASASHPRAPRLVFLGAPPSLTQRHRSVLLEELLTSIDRHDLERFFAELAEQHPRISRERFPEWVDRVMQAMRETEPPDYPLMSMNGCIRTILQQEGGIHG
ncbi:hypothetical protein [Sorangium sp. So ce385]|uniref:hypothetical protein n=1 Tax=Sorangium sp. So ce385 TaxID=3133308 RepID=UPI003F5C1742